MSRVGTVEKPGGVWDLDYWTTRWELGETQWHKAAVEPYLATHSAELFAMRPSCKVFVPLCGKSVDMKWIADLGHKVVGLEGALLAIQSFFTDQSLPYTTFPCGAALPPGVALPPGAALHRSADGAVSIYECDLFQFSAAVEGKFDAIWDTGSLMAIHAAERARYAALILSLLAPHARYLVKTLEFDPSLFAGPPCAIPEEEMRALFGATCSVSRLEEKDMLEYGRQGFCDKFDYFHTAVYLIQPH